MDSPIPELLEAFRERFLRPRRQEAYKTLRRGIERGELPQNLDLDLVLDILYGAIYMRFLIRHDELSESYVEKVCRMVLSGAAGSSHAGRMACERFGRDQSPRVDTLVPLSTIRSPMLNINSVSRAGTRRSLPQFESAAVRWRRAGLLAAGHRDDHLGRPGRSQALSHRHQDAGSSRHGRTRRRNEGTGQASKYLEHRYKSLGLKPAGTSGYLQPFTVTTGAKLKSDNTVIEDIGGKKQPLMLNQDFVPASFSSSGVPHRSGRLCGLWRFRR